MRSTTSYTAAVENIAALMRRNRSPYFEQLAGLISRISAQMTAVGGLHENPSPTNTPAANFKRVQDAAKKLEDARKAAFAQTSEIVGSGVRELQAKIDAKVKLIPNEHAKEIREVFRLLPPSDKPKFLNDLAVANKGPELAAIIAVPSILTGISDEMQGQFRDLIVSNHAGNEMREMAELTNAMNDTFIALDVAKTFVGDLADPDRLADIEKRERAAQEADSAFKSATAGVITSHME